VPDAAPLPVDACVPASVLLVSVVLVGRGADCPDVRWPEEGLTAIGAILQNLPVAYKSVGRALCVSTGGSG
jgi:hypothetical protein